MREGEKRRGRSRRGVVGLEAARMWKLVGVQAGDISIGIRVGLVGKKE
jgi:hypothetical protein